ncbi:MAG: MerR family transcriptional regulator [Dermatophilaceae bacterium]
MPLSTYHDASIGTGPARPAQSAAVSFGESDLAWLTLLTRLRATGMPVAQMLEYAEPVRSGSGEVDRLRLLEQHRERTNHLRAELDACTELLDTKIAIYRSRVAAERS